MNGPIVFVAPNYHPRTCGVGDNSMRLADELRRRGWRTVVLSREPVIAHPESPSVEARGVRGATPAVIAWRMFAEIRELEPTLVIIQYTPQMLGASRFGSLAMPLLATRLRRHGVATIVVAHELFVPWSWRPDLALGAALQRVYFIWLMWAAQRLAVTTASRLRIPTLRWFRRRSQAPGVVRIGSNAPPAMRSASGARRRLGVYSTLAVGKRIDVVVGAFARLSPTYPDLELVLIGDFDRESDRYTELVDLIRRSGSDRVIVTGKLPLAQVAAEVAACEAFLFPMNTGANTRSSTLPLAFACGVPVVAVKGSETDGALFRDAVNIIFADALDPEAFARATRRLLEDRRLAADVGQGGQALYKDCLCWPRIADVLLELAGLGVTRAGGVVDQRVVPS